MIVVDVREIYCELLNHLIERLGISRIAERWVPSELCMAVQV